MSVYETTTEQAIASNKVMVFSKSYCPYCNKAKALLNRYGVKFESYELDVRDDGAQIQAYLAKKTGQRTVPNIFINGTQIGGCDDLHRLDATKELQKLLADSA
ncbi:thioredoxin reductase [Entophlyctis luteolus]|nr:thioredoxin reductase [Entophlyctis luteolus]KAJ3345116.1 thioredoxin reductase [Entophlyctis luteolus]KAJ3383264.1 thioredoxin reductase [Entophlyctis sp. JEL0112]